MRVLRTPDSRFVDLPDYPFEPHYLEVEPNVRMHYVDEGPRDGSVVLMLHGEPSWSYLYRHMIPPVVEAGHRVIAPDLIGFGKSDKPADRSAYTYATHVAWVGTLLERLDLTDITLVCQDWGSLIGLRLAAEMEPRFGRIALSNGMLPTGSERVPPVFAVWKAFSRYSPIFPIARIVQAGTKRKLSSAEVAAYDAPFPSGAYKAGARVFPGLVPTSPDDPAAPAQRAAWEVFERWEKPFLLAFSDGDPITRGGDRYVKRRVPGAEGQPHVTLRGGHFVQEDSPRDFAEAVNALIASDR